VGGEEQGGCVLQFSRGVCRFEGLGGGVLAGHNHPLWFKKLKVEQVERAGCR